MKINENIAAAMIEENVVDTTLWAENTTASRRPVWEPVYCISGYSGMFETSIAMIVFRNNKTGKHSSQPFSDGQSLGNPFVCDTLVEAINQSRKAF